MVIYDFEIIIQLIKCQEIMFEALWFHTRDNYSVIAAGPTFISQMCNFFFKFTKYLIFLRNICCFVK